MKKIVVKVGTSLLSREDGSLNEDYIFDFAEDIYNLYSKGNKIIIVSSGAIAAGIGKLNLSSRPKHVLDKQALAAIGQPLLMQAYEKAFQKFGVPVAQVLLTRDDLENRNRYLMARDTIFTLLKYKTIPIINENDTVAIEEIEFGDNDTLASIVSSKLDADYLIILTNVDGLYSDDPIISKDAKLIKFVSKITPEIKEIAKKTKISKFSTGGMYTKVQAAEIATLSGVTTIVANGKIKNVVSKIICGEDVGTKFMVSDEVLKAKKRWILFAAKPVGKIKIDDGAVEAIRKYKRSLLPSGVIAVENKFSVGDVVSVVDKSNKEIARGLVYYADEEIRKIMGKKTNEIKNILPNATYEEIIHRNNLVLV